MRGLLHILTRWKNVLGHTNTTGWVEAEYTNTYPYAYMNVTKSPLGECYVEYIGYGDIPQTVYLAPGQTQITPYIKAGKITVRFRGVKQLRLHLTDDYTHEERTIVIVYAKRF